MPLVLHGASEGIPDAQLLKAIKNGVSKINIDMMKGFHVIVDKDRIPYKIKKLNFVLNQKQLDMKVVKYIDMRFKDPIVGKK